MKSTIIILLVLLCLGHDSSAQNAGPSTVPVSELDRRLQIMANGQVTSQTRRELQQDQFLRVERIARMPVDMQKSQISQLYREFAPELLGFGYSEGLSSLAMPANIVVRDNQPLAHPLDTTPWIGQLDQRAATASPEAVLQSMIQAHGPNIVVFVIRRRCTDIFQKHPDEVAKLIDADLATGAVPDGIRAFNAIGILKLTQYESKMIDIEAAHNELSRQATSLRMKLSAEQARRDAATTQPGNAR